MSKAKKLTTKKSLQNQVAQAKLDAPQLTTLNAKPLDLRTPIQPAPALSADFDASESEAPYVPSRRRRWHRPISIVLGLAAVLILLISGFSLVYAGKVYPGVMANGVYLGGLSQVEASSAMKTRLDEYGRQLIPVTYGDTTVRLSPENMGVKYDSDQAVKLALSYGRDGDLPQRLKAWIRALAGRATNITIYSYNYAKLTPYLSQIDTDINRPVKNAGFSFSGSSAIIDPAVAGQRLDLGRLTILIQDRLAHTSSENIDAPTYELAPAIDTDSLQLAKVQADRYLDGPLTLKLVASTAEIKPAEVVAWINIANLTPITTGRQNQIFSIFPAPAQVSIQIDQTKVAAYVADLAKKIDQPGQDAALTITDGKATVFRPSRDGVALNQPQTVTQIIRALNEDRTNRQITLDIKVKKPEVTEDSLNNLGIKELLSEGYSTFPGSSRARLTNVRIGAARYNGVLLKPDQVFSFGALLGDVGPAQGYEPSLVIIGTKEEKQYGGGLCQVSSTAFRAALNAGLPIVERVNHSFAVDFYTQPYGVPGVDATIYYPDVDFKFKNDTGHYILIQTVMDGTTLKFDFFGTKAKEGKIRGPQFIYGSLDATQPSHTVFYRDVLDLAGIVTKTDTFHTYYKSSKDFVIVENQFH